MFQHYIIKQILIIKCIYLGVLVCGYNATWSAPSIPILVDPKRTPMPEAITEDQASWLASVLFMGIFIGPGITGYYSNLRGRKQCFIIAGAITIVANAMMLVPVNLAILLVARFIIGFGLGIIFSMAIIYLGEIAMTNIRGIALSGIIVASSSGTLMVYCVAPYVSYEACLGIPLIMITVFTIGACYIPDSPIFAMMKGDDKNATNILTSLGREKEMESVLASRSFETGHTWTELFTVKSNRKALLITITLGSLQHFCGVTATVVFSTSIFSMLGSSIDSNISTIIIGLTLVISSLCSPLFIEKCGRRILLLLSTATCFLSLILLGAYFYVRDKNPALTEKLHWLPLLLLVVLLLSYNAGFSTVTATLMGEMFDPNLRSIGTSIAFTASYASAFMVTVLFSYMMAIGGHFTFWFFAANCAVAFIIAAIFVPETKGKTLAEVQYMLSK